MTQLTMKFLNGQTTPDEEHLLAQRLRGNPDIERWLTEDETATYESIVSQHRRSRRLLRWAAATAVGIVMAAGAATVSYRLTSHTGAASATPVPPVTAVAQVTAADGTPADGLPAVAVDTTALPVPDSSLTVPVAHVVADTLHVIRQRLLDFCARVPQEQVYLHTDRPYYVPGDTVWLRAHLVDGVTHVPVSRSRYVYVELLDNRADTLITRIMVKCDSTGVFANALALPRHLRSGSYTLAAYTQWMRNFPTERFCYKQIAVVDGRQEQASFPRSAAPQHTPHTLDLAVRKGELLIQLRETEATEPLSCVIFGSGNLVVTDYTTDKVLRISSHLLRPGMVSVAMVGSLTGHVVAEGETCIEAAPPKVTVSGQASRQNAPMTLAITVADADGIPLCGSFSLSVTDYDVVRPDTVQPTISEQLLHLPFGYTPTDMLSGQQPRIRYGFQTSQTITGSIRGTLFKHIKHPKLMLVRPDTGYRRTLELGDSSRFTLTGLDFPDGTVYVLEGMRQTGSTSLVQLDIDPIRFPTLHVPRGESASITLPAAFATQAQQQVMYGSADRTIELAEVVKEAKRRHRDSQRRIQTAPLRSYYDDTPALNQFATMQVLLSSLGVTVSRNTEGDYVLRNRTYNKFEPIVYIDNVESNAEELLTLWPSMLKSIEYYKPHDPSLLAYRWDAPESGLLLVRLKPGYAGSREKPASMVTVRQQGYQPAPTFYSPQYADPSAKTRPDRRPTLYWNPNVQTDADGCATVRFYASDVSRRYLVTLEGVSDDGTVIHHQQVIE